MKVLFVNQFFYPDMAPSGQLILELSEYLVAQGVEVSVVCSQSSYAPSGLPILPEQTHHGIRIYRTRSTDFGRLTWVGRLIDYLSFYATAAWKCLRLPRHDVMVARWTPPLISLVALPLRWFKRTRYINWVHDVYPDIGIALGVWGERSMTARIIDALARVALQRADSVICISELMREKLLAKGVRPDRLHVITDWADGQALGPVARDTNWFIQRHGLEGCTTVCYSGNMGAGHEFSTLLGAALRLRDRPDIRFLFIGAGTRRSEIETFIERHRLPNVQLLPYQLRDDLRFSLSAGDIHAITMRSGMEGLMVPCKMYGILACGRPIIYIGPSPTETDAVIRAADCGEVIDVGDEEALVGAITLMAREAAERERRGRNGRRYFEQHFDRPVAMRRLYRLVCDVAGAVPQDVDVPVERPRAVSAK